MENTDAINLLERYATEQKNEFREEFATFKSNKLKFCSDENAEFGLKTGDVILFKNGYGVEMISEILGFDENGKAYMLWDCYWFAINLHERFIKKVQL